VVTVGQPCLRGPGRSGCWPVPRGRRGPDVVPVLYRIMFREIEDSGSAWNVPRRQLHGGGPATCRHLSRQDVHTVDLRGSMLPAQPSTAPTRVAGPVVTAVDGGLAGPSGGSKPGLPAAVAHAGVPAWGAAAGTTTTAVPACPRADPRPTEANSNGPAQDAWVARTAEVPALSLPDLGQEPAGISQAAAAVPASPISSLNAAYTRLNRII
jgi:hypothetical protein